MGQGFVINGPCVLFLYHNINVFLQKHRQRSGKSHITMVIVTSPLVSVGFFLPFVTLTSVFCFCFSQWAVSSQGSKTHMPGPGWVAQLVSASS